MQLFDSIPEALFLVAARVLPTCRGESSTLERSSTLGSEAGSEDCGQQKLTRALLRLAHYSTLNPKATRQLLQGSILNGFYRFISLSNACFWKLSCSLRKETSVQSYLLRMASSAAKPQWWSCPRPWDACAAIMLAGSSFVLAGSIGMKLCTCWKWRDEALCLLVKFDNLKRENSICHISFCRRKSRSLFADSK